MYGRSAQHLRRKGAGATMYRYATLVIAAFSLLAGCNTEPKGPASAPTKKSTMTQSSAEEPRSLPAKNTSSHDAAYAALSEKLNIRQQQRDMLKQKQFQETFVANVPRSNNQKLL